MSVVPATIARDLSPTGSLRAHRSGQSGAGRGHAGGAGGVTVDIARELGSRADPGRARLRRCGAEVARGADGGAG